MIVVEHENGGLEYRTEVVVGGRRTGKTHKMLKWMHDHHGLGAAVVVATTDMGDYLRRAYEQRFGQAFKGQIVSARQAADGRLRGYREQQIAVDNTELVLQTILRSPQPSMITINGEVTADLNAELPTR